MRWTINFDPKIYKTTDNTVPILLRISLNSEHDYINTGRRINSSQIICTQGSKKDVKKGVKGYLQLTTFIAMEMSKIDTMLKDYDDRNEVITLTELKQHYYDQDGQAKPVCYFKYVEKMIIWEDKNTKISKAQLYGCKLATRWLKDFVNHPDYKNKYRGKLTVYQINEDLISEYGSYIQNILKLSRASEYRGLTTLRKYTKKLFTTGVIKKYPFATYQIGKAPQVEIEYFELEELNKLQELYDSGMLLTIWRRRKTKFSRKYHIGLKYQLTLRLFLLSCYTGLRYSDVIKFHENPKQFIKGNMVVIECQKGHLGVKTTVRIPIRERLKTLIESNRKIDKPIAQMKHICNSYTNKLLKQIIVEVLDWDKDIHFHCSRHTFAISSLVLGIKLEVVSDILGHSSLTTTQIYARIVDSLRNLEMDKWDKLSSVEPNPNPAPEASNTIACPNCENPITKLDTSIIKLSKVPMTCPYCSTSFNYDVNGNKPARTIPTLRVITN